jgi:hypothetical protein
MRTKVPLKLYSSNRGKGSSNRGKGSPTFSRRLGAEELQTIDDFVQDTHNNGGSLSVRQIADHLMEKHSALLVSSRAIRYALIVVGIHADKNDCISVYSLIQSSLLIQT